MEASASSLDGEGVRKTPFSTIFAQCTKVLDSRTVRFLITVYDDDVGSSGVFRTAEYPVTSTSYVIPAGAWGPNEVVRHLIAVELEVHQSRLRDLATSEEPQWVWAEPGPWPGEPERTLDELLDRFAALRAATLATVDALDDDGWSRTGTHASLGRWDVEGLLQSAIDHDAEHLAALR